MDKEEIGLKIDEKKRQRFLFPEELQTEEAQRIFEAKIWFGVLFQQFSRIRNYDVEIPFDLEIIGDKTILKLDSTHIENLGIADHAEQERFQKLYPLLYIDDEKSAIIAETPHPIALYGKLTSLLYKK